MTTKSFCVALMSLLTFTLLVIVPSVHSAPNELIARDEAVFTNITASDVVIGYPEVNCGPLGGPQGNMKNAKGFRIQEGVHYLRSRPKSQMCGTDVIGPPDYPPWRERISCSYNSGIYVMSEDGKYHTMTCNDAGEWLEYWLVKCYYLDCDPGGGSGFHRCKEPRNKYVSGYLGINQLLYYVFGERC